MPLPRATQLRRRSVVPALTVASHFAVYVSALPFQESGPDRGYVRKTTVRLLGCRGRRMIERHRLSSQSGESFTLTIAPGQRLDRHRKTVSALKTSAAPSVHGSRSDRRCRGRGARAASPFSMGTGRRPSTPPRNIAGQRSAAGWEQRQRHGASPERIPGTVARWR